MICRIGWCSDVASAAKIIESRGSRRRRNWMRRAKGVQMQHIRSLCTRLAEHAKERVKLGEILLNGCVARDTEKRREKSMGFVAAVAAELYRVDSKLHGA